MKRKAFTLAEVLITLVVIGIVAAITIPIVITNQQEVEKEARVKKTFGTMANAMTMVKAQGGDFIFDVTGDEDLNLMKNWFNTYFKPYVNVMKTCYNTSGCWTEGDTLSMNGSVARWNQKGKGLGTNIITAVLTDGTFICIDGHRGYNLRDYFGVNTTAEYGIAITFDVNGAKKPNTIGKDIFVSVFTPNGVAAAYKDKTSAQIKSDCSKSGTGYACIQKYLRQNQT